MIQMRISMLPVALLLASVSVRLFAEPVPAAPNGIEFPADYADWRVISISHRTDHHSMRSILGNDIAVAAARSGHTHPWPDGSVLGKVVWKEGVEQRWPSAIAPRQFVHAEFMFKDAGTHADNGTGWGWARWVGNGLKPYGKPENSEQECIACHTLTKSEDWVFSVPAQFPTEAE